MNHTGTVALETSRLLLRRFTETDAEAAYANWTSDLQVTEFLRWPVHDSVEVTRTILGEWIRCYRQHDFYQWAIVLKGADQGPIGTISVVDQDERLNSVRIGYCIGSSWWHQGITSEPSAGSYRSSSMRYQSTASSHSTIQTTGIPEKSWHDAV